MPRPRLLRAALLIALLSALAPTLSACGNPLYGLFGERYSSAQTLPDVKQTCHGCD